MKSLLLALFFLTSTVTASEVIYSFQNPRDKNQFDVLTSQLRCLVCQNQNLSESNSLLANDLKQQIYLKIRNGESRQSIIQYLLSRYGEYILYKPLLNKQNSFLWFSPFFILISGLTILFFQVSKKEE